MTSAAVISQPTSITTACRLLPSADAVGLDGSQLWIALDMAETHSASAVAHFARRSGGRISAMCGLRRLRRIRK
jgi:hypothetical protein